MVHSNWSVGALALVLGCGAVAQERPKKQDPAIAEAIEQVEDAWKDRRMRQDAQATTWLAQLEEALANPLHKKDEKAIVKVATFVLMKGKLREPDKAQPYREAIDILSRLGDDGGKVLMGVWDKKRFPRHREWVNMRAELLTGICETQGRGTLEFVLKAMVRTGEDEVLLAGGTALGVYSEADEDVRKEVVDLLASRLSGFESLAAQSPVNSDQELNLDGEAAKRIIKKIREPWKLTMTKMTGKEFSTGYEWAKWFRDNKKKRWDESTKKKRGR